MKENEIIKVVDEMADICCRWHDVWKSCLNCWRRTNGCSTYPILYGLAKQGYRKPTEKGGVQE